MENLSGLTKDKKIRFLKEMTDVVYDSRFAQVNPNIELYEVYRDIKQDDDLRWDITVMSAKMIGKEFVRTKGNRNNKGFRELYTVIEGEAIFLIQKAKDGQVDDVFAVNAHASDWVIIPPDYEVVTINPSPEKKLTTGNWVSNKTENIYEDIEKFKGACYFYTTDGWIKNENYRQVPELRFEKPLKNSPENLDFLRTGTN